MCPIMLMVCGSSSCPRITIYGQWDMHETMPAGYWHYYYQAYSASDPDYGQYAPGILYPSAAGTSNQIR